MSISYLDNLEVVSRWNPETQFLDVEEASSSSSSSSKKEAIVLKPKVAGAAVDESAKMKVAFKVISELDTLIQEIERNERGLANFHVEPYFAFRNAARALAKINTLWRAGLPKFEALQNEIQKCENGKGVLDSVILNALSVFTLFGAPNVANITGELKARIDKIKSCEIGKEIFVYEPHVGETTDLIARCTRRSLESKQIKQIYRGFKDDRQTYSVEFCERALKGEELITLVRKADKKDAFHDQGSTKTVSTRFSKKPENEDPVELDVYIHNGSSVKILIKQLVSQVFHHVKPQFLTYPFSFKDVPSESSQYGALVEM